jgi:DNA-binding transcriptional LysR family regulator
MMPRSFLAAKGAALGLCALDAPLPRHAIEIAMCWHDRTHADPAASAFRALVREVVTKAQGLRRTRAAK